MKDCRESDRVLLVEGENDKHVILQMCIRIPGMPEFCIIAKGDVETVLDSIANELRVDGRKAVGIVVDANDKVTKRWRAVTKRLRAVGIDAPEQPERDGFCIEGTRLPRVGIWLMPDNESMGELEDFVCSMLPDDDPVWPRSKSYIDGIPEVDRKFTAKKALRARVHAWLATRSRPRLMGVAVHDGDLQINGELATRFSDWLRLVFGGLE